MYEAPTFEMLQAIVPAHVIRQNLYCGWKGWKVTDFGVFDRENACARHDWAYTTGLPRLRSDRVFMCDMLRATRPLHWSVRWYFRLAAHSYYRAVRLAGWKTGYRTPPVSEADLIFRLEVAGAYRLTHYLSTHN